MDKDKKELFKQFGISVVRAILPLVTTLIGALLGTHIGGTSDTALLGCVMGASLGNKLV